MVDKLLQVPYTLKYRCLTPRLMSEIFETVLTEVRFINICNSTRDHQSLITFSNCENNKSNFSRVGGTFCL